MMILVTKRDQTKRWEARQYKENWGVGNSYSMVCNMKCILPRTVIIPDICCNVHLGMHNHLMDWVTSFLGQHSRIDNFNQLGALLPQYPGFTWFYKPFTQVTKWSGTEVNAHRHAIVPAFAPSIVHPSVSQTIPFTEALLCINNLVYFHCIAQYWYHTQAETKYRESDFNEVHRHKDVFSLFSASKSTKKVPEALNSSVIWTNWRNRRVTPLGTISLRLQSVVALIRIMCRVREKLNNIRSTNRILTFCRCISWTTSVIPSASFTTSSVQALNSHRDQWWIFISKM